MTRQMALYLGVEFSALVELEYLILIREQISSGPQP
jgi:hypothetical protein